MQTMFVELSLNVEVKQRNLASSSVFHSVHDTDGCPPRSENNAFSFLECIENFGRKIMEIKIAKINAPLNFKMALTEKNAT